ncbi:MAG TPA: secretin N-terminal domain-containing protein [Candidatus Baltobacteraceae bacterium]|jgi:type II secretory pathway component GspD/PulD (secretin)|nr:secretin N-terminal domain-containing protein [Candidatus Baltobacteraceae bacterium]
MKTRDIIAIATALFTAGWVASAAGDDVGGATNTAADAAQAQPVADTNMPAEAFPTNGIVLNFHNVPLSAVLNYLSAKAGLVIVYDANLQGTVSVVAKQPIGTNEIVDLLNDQLSRNNLGAILEGRTLQIMDIDRIKSLATTPVKVASGPNQIPETDAIVTEILPVNTLNPAQLIKDLEPLIPKNATVSANDAGSAIIMTASGKDVHRISEIIAALDSSAVSDVEVFVLKYADAKSVASELKEVYESADSDVSRANARNSFAQRGRGGPGGGGFNPFGMGGGGGGGGSSDEAKNSQTHAVFVSDDQMNAVVASAPPSYMPSITNVIQQLDQASQDITEIRVFRLKHADPVEIATELGDLFPSSTASSDQNNRSMGFRFAPPWMQQASQGAAKSDRMKQQTSVLAVADRRTESIVVTASRDLMEEIKGMITQLDEGNQGMTHVTAIPLESADPAAVQQTIAGLFLSTGSSSSSTTTTALSARTQGNNNSQSSSTTSSTSGFGSGSSGSSALH